MWKVFLTILFIVVYTQDIDFADECKIEETFMYDGLLMVLCHDDEYSLPELADEDDVELVP